jgi:NodT family efflux transporter outer membrane factor (OMF) lipoprotein
MMQSISDDSKSFREPSLPMAAAAMLTCLFGIGGCTAGPNFTRPEPPPTTRYTANKLNSENVAASETAQHIALGREIEGDWWTLFGSEAIDQLVKQAVNHNRNLEAAQATLRQAQQLALARTGLKYPQVSLSAGVGRQQYGQEFLGGFGSIPPFTYYSVGPAVSYTLDYTGGVARSVERQEALADIERYQLNAAYLTVTGNAVMQVLAIASARAQIATVDTILSEDNDNLRLVQTAFDNGSVSREDVVSVRSQIANDTTFLPPLRQDLARARHALAVILGQVPADELPPEVDFAQIILPLQLPVSLPSELAHRRPDILAAEARMHAATSAVGIAQSNLYPKIQLSASVGQQSLQVDQLFDRASNAWSLISGLTAPIFNGGTLLAEKRAAVEAMHASAANYAQTVLEAFAQVADLLEALDHDTEQLDAQAQAQEAAQSSIDLARASYREGNSSVLQVLDAERLYQQARLGYVRAVVQRYMDTVQLFLALGGTSPNDNATSSDTMPQKE